MSGILDKYMGKWASRKLVVFVFATLLVYSDKISGEDWTYIAIAYIVIQGVVDAKDFISIVKR